MPSAEYLGIVIAAGGGGSRFGAENKLFMELRGLPLFIWSVRNFLAVCPGANIVISASAEALPEFQQYLTKLLPDSGVQLVPGGMTRPESVINGLQALPEGLKWVAVHDAARPLADAELLMACLEKAAQFGGAAPVKAVTDTIKKVDAKGFAITTIDRAPLRAIETPQIFDLEKLRQAYESLGDQALDYTDDAGVFTACGGKVFLLDNPSPNLKLTYPEDYRILQQLV
jgi:2-C-methyl-D-erythritol 4-phosphate cytidylyltransferase